MTRCLRAGYAREQLGELLRGDLQHGDPPEEKTSLKPAMRDVNIGPNLP